MNDWMKVAGKFLKHFAISGFSAMAAYAQTTQEVKPEDAMMAFIVGGLTGGAAGGGLNAWKHRG